jgi:hypothetical protein
MGWHEIKKEGSIMRGQIKLFTLQMDPNRARQYRNAAATEDSCFGTCRNEVSSLQQIILPSLKMASGR